MDVSERSDRHASSVALAQPEDARAVAEDVGGEDVVRHELSGPQQGGQRDLAPVLFDDQQNGRVRDLPEILEPREHRRLEHAHPHVETDAHQHDAGEERQAPAPLNQRLVADQPGHERQRSVGQDQSERRAHLRKARREAAALGIGPLAGHEDRPAPFAADGDALQRPENGQNHRAPDADRRIRRDEADQRRRDPHQHHRRDEERFAADAIAEVTEDRGAQRTGGEPGELRREGQQRRDVGIGAGKERLRENQRGCRVVEEEVVPLDRGADGGGRNRPDHLPAHGGRIQREAGGRLARRRRRWGRQGGRL